MNAAAEHGNIDAVNSFIQEFKENEQVGCWRPAVSKAERSLGAWKGRLINRQHDAK